MEAIAPSRRRCLTTAALLVGFVAGFAMAALPAGAHASTSPRYASSRSLAPAATPTDLSLNNFGRILVDPATSHVFVSSPGSNAVVVLDFNGKIVQTITGETGAGAGRDNGAAPLPARTATPTNT